MATTFTKPKVGKFFLLDHLKIDIYKSEHNSNTEFIAWFMDMLHNNTQ